jgi:hypothetical protein
MDDGAVSEAASRPIGSSSLAAGAVRASLAEDSTEDGIAVAVAPPLHAGGRRAGSSGMSADHHDEAVGLALRV